MMNVDKQKVFFASKRPATSHCFDFAGRSLRAAEIQMDRIWNRPVVSGSYAVVEAAIHDILIDIHFYFVALRNVYRFLAKVVEDPAFQQFKPDVEQLNNAGSSTTRRGEKPLSTSINASPVRSKNISWRKLLMVAVLVRFITGWVFVRRSSGTPT